MIQYVDPIPPIVTFLSVRLNRISVYGNIAKNPVLPALIVKSAGGAGFSRIQLLARAEKDFEAMELLIQTMMLLEQYANQIQGIRVTWCGRESNPFPSVDQDTGTPEAWCYMRLEHVEG
ncbi:MULTISPECIES: hypothetical protein [unclassified Thermoactinomyces]|uniref:hypothetical protein n=1 Tax=unclassified Thermoactinomyces TaxID=2634588 RepID=UPI0018DB4224|nr:MULTISPECIES: hypothetical protein [unclassified Thermoactinomyces]MBH8599072.1 hypothetical protein [Thermoactinomyces sp. CICC 10523]MBH8607997.1 hypothetical protein [Thermoactinomyces sp. CICC 10521]